MRWRLPLVVLAVSCATRSGNSVSAPLEHAGEAEKRIPVSVLTEPAPGTRMSWTACHDGEARACAVFADVHMHLGNMSHGLRLLGKTCDWKDVLSCRLMAFVEEKRGNLAEAKSFLGRACEAGDADACDEARLFDEKIARKRTLVHDCSAGSDVAGCAGFEKSGCFEADCLGRRVRDCFLLLGRIAEVQRKAELALAFRKRACAAGDARACEPLAVDVEQKHNSVKCGLGDFPACVALGRRLQGKNSTVARALCREACHGNLVDGCIALGELDATAGNVHEARGMLNGLCRKGLQEGCAALARFELEHGDKRKAVHLYAKSCDAGFFKSCTELGSLFWDRNERGRARPLLEKACSGGDERACSMVPYAEAGMGRSDPEPQAMPCGDKARPDCSLAAVFFRDSPRTSSEKVTLRRFCAARHPDACRILARDALRDDDVETSQEWFRRSCEAGESGACLTLGLLAGEKGRGPEADHFVKKACRGGTGLACALLEEPGR